MAVSIERQAQEFQRSLADANGFIPFTKAPNHYPHQLLGFSGMRVNEHHDLEYVFIDPKGVSKFLEHVNQMWGYLIGRFPGTEKRFTQPRPFEQERGPFPASPEPIAYTLTFRFPGVPNGFLEWAPYAVSQEIGRVGMQLQAQNPGPTAAPLAPSRIID